MSIWSGMCLECAVVSVNVTLVLVKPALPLKEGCGITGAVPPRGFKKMENS